MDSSSHTLSGLSLSFHSANSSPPVADDSISIKIESSYRHSSNPMPSRPLQLLEERSEKFQSGNNEENVDKDDDQEEVEFSILGHQMCLKRQRDSQSRPFSKRLAVETALDSRQAVVRSWGNQSLPVADPEISVLCLPIFLFFIFQRQRTKTNIKLPPGPQGLPFIGNLHQFDVSKPQVSYWELSKKYGPLMSLRLGFVPALVVSSAKMAKEILKTHDLQFCSRPALLGQQKLSYNGLDLAFSPYDEYWREIRKICVVHLLNSNRVQNFRPIRQDEVSRMIEKVSKSAAALKPVNLSEIMMSLTSTITCRLGFGKRYEDEALERSRFHGLLNETQALFVSFFVTDYFPHMGWLDKLTGMIRRLETNFQEFDRFYEELIEEHLDPKRTKLDQHEDIIDVLLQIRKDRVFKFDLTSDHIKAVLMNVFVAGTDTSAATVVWAMTYLMKHPKAMKKVQEEIRCLIGNKGFVDEDDVQELPYLKAVVKETMRLQPTVPILIPRETTEISIIDGYEIPAKTLVFVNAWAIGRDPEAWENPEEFYPERFINSPIDFKGQHYELIPFGAGRRICPGISMGIATVDLALANLLYKFDWEMPCGLKIQDLDLDVLPGITMHKKNALTLVAKHNE